MPAGYTRRRPLKDALMLAHVEERARVRIRRRLNQWRQEVAGVDDALVGKVW